MKYIEYLKLVKAMLAAPGEPPQHDGSLKPHPICYASSDALIELQTAARQVQDKAAEKQAGEHYLRLDQAVARTLFEINRQLPEYQHACMYPSAVYTLMVHRGRPQPAATDARMGAASTPRVDGRVDRRGGAAGEQQWLTHAAPARWSCWIKLAPLVRC